MNMPITVDANDFTLQSISNWAKVPKKAGYVLLIKWYKCGHCVEYLPKFEQFATKHPNVGFLIMESTDNATILQQWGELQKPMFEVNGYPTVILYTSKGDPYAVVKDRNNLSIELNQMLL